MAGGMVHFGLFRHFAIDSPRKECIVIMIGKTEYDLSKRQKGITMKLEMRGNAFYSAAS